MGRDVVWVFQQELPDDRKAKDLVAVQFIDLDVSAVPTGSLESCRSSVCRDPEEDGLNTVHRNRTGELASETEGGMMEEGYLGRQRQSPLLRSFIWAAPEVWLRFRVSLSASII